MSPTLLRRALNRARDLQFLPPFDPLWRRQLNGRVLCLLYHRVDQPGRIPFLDRFGVPPISASDLNEEILFLKLQGAQFLTFADLRRGRFPGQDQFGVIVSFDDGLRDAYRRATGVLERLDVPAVLFQSSGLVDAPTLIWEHSLYWHAHTPGRAKELTVLAHARLPASRGLTGDALVAHLREAEPMEAVEDLLAEATARAGAKAELARLAQEIYPTAADLRWACREQHEIGSHGHHHYPRHAISRECFESELSLSRQRLEEITGVVPKAFSYPFNSHQLGDAEICARHYRQVATVEARLITRTTDPMEMPRCTWPGPIRNRLQFRRWLWTGHL